MKLFAPLATALLVMMPFAPLLAEPLQPGADAPALKVLDQTGKEIDLGAEFKTGVTLVYFYPKADTPGCTKQACNIRDQKALLQDAGIKVFGVSADTVQDQRAFSDKFTLPFPLLADKEGKVIAAFGVPTNERGFAQRQSFLIKNGKVIWHQPKANPVTQAEDAIAALKANG
ncbi:MAG: peroxiredoxin Q/BCP [Verrucomicrobia bacterium]|jgi:peroxiredoxin Q/BCP|nr:MAG: peroxiredoxin Q/BCP [Verrucomicrobiota bacterium]